MTNNKRIISFSLALFFAGSISISSINVQAKEIVSKTKIVSLATKQSKLRNYNSWI